MNTDQNAADLFAGDTASSAGAETPPDLLRRLAQLVGRQLDLEGSIEDKEKQLKELREQHRRLSEEDIPAILDETGLSELRLADGTRVRVTETLRVSTSGKWREPINAWLERTGHDDIIKDEVVASFGKGMGDEAQRVIDEIRALGIEGVERKRFVAPPTFAALVRELSEAGQDVPLDELGIYVQRATRLDRQ